MHDLYRHLKSYGFVRGRDVKRLLDKFSEAKLGSLLESYLDIARNRPLVRKAPWGVTDIYPDSRGSPLQLSIIRQLAIYVGKIYIHDPLLDMVYKWQRLDHTMPLFVKYQSRAERVRFFSKELASVIERLFLLEPLVEAGIVHLTPTELIHPKPEPGAMYVDDFYGPGDSLDDPLGPRKTLEDLPPQLKEYCDSSLVVWPNAFVNGELTTLTSEPLSPRNMIAVGFSGDTYVYDYQLFDILPPTSALA
jgi:hypothetical protein